MPKNVCAIIAAAGKGERLPGGVAKQFRVMGGVPLLVWSLKAFAAVKDVKRIVIGTAPGEVQAATDMVKGILPDGMAGVVAGGRERQETVKLCLDAVPPDAELVVIHDAARPFVTPDLIRRTIKTAAARGAATAAVRPSDTVKFEHATRGVKENLDRERLWLIQTPQAFRKDLLVKAHEAAAAQGFIGTDDTALVERMGGSVEIVRGSELNLKITTEADWMIAEALVQAGKVKPL
ncbi:MAG TPA: 2-C-methyl-D-erythritol 4-phosphate cytidylyltransferase [bacterium]|nr:2-C-methyl-D-erythritol 4-phosphate cytidylyltransferase [bacterium]